ncbi:class I SAM-dependent methyltransferase [Liquorilactobacillus oeni]|uniref:Adenine-specific DNA methylase n=1 Tax=Liquorilactobacillus oeni DSM 19972 TaxID=1423777 RepID=A0A0R1M774_9LACO|nr:class I SAM-dependent methyltransferase [Liquorilactobacillus oeni]KRL03983.1 adenine-specific DNA methylase [Liquorilactobacillus oeni DSM 19972]
MRLEKIKDTYHKFDETINLLRTELGLSYLDALIESGDNLVDKGKVLVEKGKPSLKIKKQLETKYKQILAASLSSEEIRQVLQFALIEANHYDKIQANHQITPDSIGFLVAYLIERITVKRNIKNIFDIAVGTGNLLTTVNNHLKKNGYNDFKLFGVDNDDTMLAIAEMSARLQRIKIELYHQDAIDSLLIPKADVVVADLPIGYYPLDKRVQNFETRAQSGHSYAHHLMIEQALLYLVPGGYAFFLVPKGLFESTEAKGLLKVIQKQGLFQGMLNLPEDLFTSKNNQKSLLLLQKRGGKAKQAKPVLLGNIPTFKEKEAFSRFIQQVDEWISKNIKD